MKREGKAARLWQRSRLLDSERNTSAGARKHGVHDKRNTKYRDKPHNTMEIQDYLFGMNIYLVLSAFFLKIMQVWVQRPYVLEAQSESCEVMN